MSEFTQQATAIGAFITSVAVCVGLLVLHDVREEMKVAQHNVYQTQCASISGHIRCVTWTATDNEAMRLAETLLPPPRK